MINKLQKENEQFVNEWILKRKKGFLKYVLSHILSLGIMAFFIYCIDLLISDEKNYGMRAIIYAVLVFIMSISSWLINEFRYQRNCRKKQLEK